MNQTPVGSLPPRPAGIGGSLIQEINQISRRWGYLQGYNNAVLNNQDALNDLVNGTETLNQLNALITQQEDEILHWDENHTDKMEELVKYWNMLETGRNTKTGPMYNWFKRLSKKKAQKDLDNNKASIIAMYNSSHSIAA